MQRKQTMMYLGTKFEEIKESKIEVEMRRQHQIEEYDEIKNEMFNRENFNGWS